MSDDRTGKPASEEDCPGDFLSPGGPNAIGLIPKSRRVTTDGNVVRPWVWPEPHDGGPTPTGDAP